MSTLYFVAQFDYCVCGVRLFKFAGVWLFGGLFLLYASGVIAGIYISSDGTCKMSSRSVLFSLVSPAPNVK